MVFSKSWKLQRPGSSRCSLLELANYVVAGIEFGTFAVIDPPGRIETYPMPGKLNVYSGRRVFVIPVTVSKDAKLGPIKLIGEMTTRLCDDETCFSPDITEATPEATIVDTTTAVIPANAELFPGGTTANVQSSIL